MALFPFKPLEDHFFGILIGKVWIEANGDIEKLNRAIHSRLVGELKNYTCTPKGDRVMLMNIYPNQFRQYLELKNYDKLYSEFEKLISGKVPETVSRLDIAFDLMEWIFTGFPEKEEVAVQMLFILFNRQISFSKEFMLKLTEEYYNTSSIS